MKDATPDLLASPGLLHQILNYPQRMVAAWNRFWFEPRDPTTLGLIRLIAGLLTLYTHLAYSYDLYEFFGKDAWLSNERATALRKDAPWSGPPVGWENIGTLALADLDRDTRGRVVDFMEGLPDNPDKLQRIFAAIRDPKQEAPEGVNIPGYIRGLPDDPPGAEVYRGKEQIIVFITNMYKLPAKERTDILEYMRDWGYDSRELAHRGNYIWSIWFHVTDPTAMMCIHVGILVVMLMFAVGFCTRVTSVLTWLAAVSYIQRSSITLFGGDTMMNILLLYLMIGPSGDALSVDRLLARWWALRRARKEGLPVPEWNAPQPMISANFVLRMLQIHFCFIYMSAGTSKLLGAWWWNGQAIYYTMANYEFSPLRFDFYLENLRLLCQNRPLWEILMTAGSYFTIALEIGLPFLVWNRTLRPFVVTASVMLHTSIAIFMGLAVFSLFMATMVLSFIPGEAVRHVLNLQWFRSLRDRIDNWLGATPSAETVPAHASSRRAAKEMFEPVAAGVRDERIQHKPEAEAK